ncbi:DUF6702 family protein [Rufibacter ruber]|uniref:DUF6702 family protein n=1 Tax=Rufibacter ruber TaxID=1783499 RepID=UPI000833B4BD|nr:DUF6702 family protein [Rufibacter ruber]
MKKKRRGLRPILALLVAFFLTGPAWAHEFHTSITDARYNAKNATFELSVRVFADDLEEALTRRQKTPVRLDKSERVNKLIAEYLQAHLAIAHAKGARPALRFLGLQEEADAVWLYVEIPAGKAPGGQVWVQNALLTELFTDQTNIVNVEVAGKKRSALLKTGDTQQNITF